MPKEWIDVYKRQVLLECSARSFLMFHYSCEHKGGYERNGQRIGYSLIMLCLLYPSMPKLPIWPMKRRWCCMINMPKPLWSWCVPKIMIMKMCIRDRQYTTLFHLIVVVVDFIEGLFHLCRWDVGKETQPAGIDAQYGDIPVSYTHLKCVHLWYLLRSSIL